MYNYINVFIQDLWHPLPGYKTTCWVEKLIPDARLIRNIPVDKPRGRAMTGDKLLDYGGNAAQPNTAKSKMDDYALKIMETKRRYELNFQQELFRRVKDNFMWKFRCLPYVYFIGVTKSGTSDFYRHLTIHQDIVDVKAKEIHYWNVLRYPRPALLYGKNISQTSTFLYMLW